MAVSKRMSINMDKHCLNRNVEGLITIRNILKEK